MFAFIKREFFGIVSIVSFLSGMVAAVFGLIVFAVHLGGNSEAGALGLAMMVFSPIAGSAVAYVADLIDMRRIGR